MRYIITSADRVDFVNTPQTIPVAINANGLVKTVEKPDWLTVEYIISNVKATSDDNGFTNSSVIISFDPTAAAAITVVNYVPSLYPDIIGWYLPARNEMGALITNKSLLPSNLFTYSVYWTSTDYQDTTAIGCDTVGLCAAHSKSEVLAVIPVKKITYTEVNPPHVIGDDLGYGYVYDVNTTDKIIYIVAKEDFPPVIWGLKTQLANANFTTSMNLSVNRNDRYVELTGDLKLDLQEDEYTTKVLVVTQESSDSDSQSVFLKDVIDNLMIESINIDSYLNGVSRYHILLLAKRLIQDLNYDCEKELRVYEAEINTANKVIPPIDYIDYVRLSLVTESGMLVPLFVNNNINISKKYIKDENGDIIVDNLGYPIKTQGTRNTELSSDVKKYWIASNTVDGEYIYDNALYGVTGGQQSYTGSYRYDAEAREFLLDGIPSEFTHVVIEYLSDPIAAEKDPRKIRINKYFQSPLEAGIYYKYISKLRNVSNIEKETARREFYNEVRKAQRRMFTKPQELIQRLGSDVGFNKML